MSKLLEFFGIGPQMFSSEDEFRVISGDKGDSSIEEIRKLIDLTVPRPCGHKLIRIGRDNHSNRIIKDDGKYLIPDDLGGIYACFSPGVANTKGFEDHLAEEYGIRSYMCDYSSNERNFATPLIDDLQKFRKSWLDIQGKKNSISLQEWVTEEAPGDDDLLLQIDIEGAEYRNILDCNDQILGRFRIIAMEIHGLKFLQKKEFLRGIFRPFIEKICKNFTCVHAHANNNTTVWKADKDLEIPGVIELTFLRNDRFSDQDVEVHIPHPLDIVNSREKPPIFLHGPWSQNPVSLESKMTILQQRLAWLERKMEKLEKGSGT